MIMDKDLSYVLSEAGEGEMIMAGTLLKGLSDEQIVWVVIEVVEDIGHIRFTLHSYWHNIFMVSKVVKMKISDGSLIWGVTKA